MVPRSILFLAVAFAMVLAVVADGNYGQGNYRNDYHKRYTSLVVNKAYSKGVIVGKVPALGKRYGVYWEKCAGDHYFQTHPANPGYRTFYLQFLGFSGNSKGYRYNGGYQSACTEARDSVAVEYREEGSDKWKTLATLKPDNYRTPKTVSYKVSLYGNDPCKVTFRFRSLNDCSYDNNDYGVWSFADLKLYAVGKDYGYGDHRDDDDNGYGNDRDDDDNGYGDDRDDDDHGYGDDRDDDDNGYGNDRDDDDNGYGNDRDDDDKGGYGNNKDC